MNADLDKNIADYEENPTNFTWCDECVTQTLHYYGECLRCVGRELRE